MPRATSAPVVPRLARLSSDLPAGCDLPLRARPWDASWCAGGFELLDTQSLREHYARAGAAWRANLEDYWAKAVDLVGEETARVWRLYLAGGALAFEQHRMGVDQVLFAKPAPGSGDDGH